jgi:hypothetical protein
LGEPGDGLDGCRLMVKNGPGQHAAQLLTIATRPIAFHVSVRLRAMADEGVTHVWTFKNLREVWDYAAYWPGPLRE